ncbi:MAG: hypothetical protein OXN17_09720 [Candidatus Poribacteria bacterium]|nr:hypothetical protein [Candidatus Poribacteria bacterium]MDE0506640.1 hypothetical protein [Candidatus Poribacteria bacterium]
MRLYLSTKFIVMIALSCVLTLATTVPIAQAGGGARALKVVLFTTGMGLKFGSVFVEKSAQDSYDQYLTTALQADIARHRTDYTSRRDASLVMSRAGMGLVGVAALISIFDQLDLISDQSQSAALRLTPSFDFQNRETTLSFQGHF